MNIPAPTRLLAIALAVSLTVPVACSTAQTVSDSPQSRPSYESTRWTPQSLIFGCNAVSNPHILHYPAGYLESVYESLNRLGGTMVRPSASPMNVMRTRGGRDWAKVDKEIDLILSYGQEPIILICNSPGWASVTGKDTHAYPFKDEFLPDLEEYCKDLAARFRGRVKLYQLWNEANGFGWHTHDGYNHADEYYPMLAPVYRGLKAGDPDSVLMLSSVDDSEGHGHIWVEMIYELHAKHHPDERLWDAVSMHPYSKDIGEKERKIRRMHDLMARYGDGDLPIFITEYGWRMAEQEYRRKPLVRETLLLYQKPDLDYLAGAIHLAITDFEGEPGFGLTDENLRPHESYHVFRGTPRFGASPASWVEWKPVGGNTIDVRWKTELPATCVFHLAAPGSATASFDVPAGTEHALLLKDLQPGGRYLFRITTHTVAEGKTFTSWRDTLYVPDAAVQNGGFEEGFVGGIGHGWRITGDGLCTDGGVWPVRRFREGEHAQVVFGVPERPIKLNSVAGTWVTAEPGREYTAEVRLSRASVNTEAPVRGRIGLNPSGAEGMMRSTVWGEWVDLEDAWKPASVSAAAKGDLLTVLIQIAGGADSPANSRPAGAFDSVTVTPATAP